MSVGSRSTAARPLWPDDLWPEHAARAAVASALMILSPGRWIHRRVETVEFLDERRLQRHLSIDFSIPNLRYFRDTAPKQAVLLPLGLFRKASLRGFNVTDGDDAPLPVLTQTQNAMMAQLILIQLAARAAERQGYGRVLPKSVIDNIRSITSRDADVAVAALRGLSSATGPGSALMRDAGFRTLGSEFAVSFVLYGMLGGRPGDRSIVKITWEETFQALRRPISYWIGVGTTEVNLATSFPGYGHSYHFEVEAPGDLFIARARLIPLTEFREELEAQSRDALRSRPETGEGATSRGSTPLMGPPQPNSYSGLFGAPTPATALMGIDPGSDRVGIFGADPPRPGTIDRSPIALDTNRGTRRAHLHARDIPRYAELAAELQFQVTARFLWNGIVISVLTLLIMAGGVFIHLRLDIHTRPDALTALLVIVPGIYAAFLVGPGEHRLFQTLATGVRLRVLVSALISFGAAATLTMDIQGALRTNLWIIGTAVSAVNGLMFFGQLFVAQRGERR